MEEPKKPNPFVALLRSRKFLVTVLNVIAIIVVDAIGLDPALWQSITAVCMILIGAIAYEDGQEKRAGG